MATRSNIGIRTENNTIIAAYCHWDGYLAYNGQMLFENYTDEEDILDLVALGSFSCLKETVDWIDMQMARNQFTLDSDQNKYYYNLIQEFVNDYVK